MSDSDDDIRAEFNEAVNMTAKQLENWLETDESRSVGQKDDGGEIRTEPISSIPVLRTRKVRRRPAESPTNCLTGRSAARAGIGVPSVLAGTRLMASNAMRAAALSRRPEM